LVARPAVKKRGPERFTASIDCPKCGLTIHAGRSECPSCGLKSVDVSCNETRRPNRVAGGS
jgi:C4-type Zn-finger protein